MTLSKTTVSMPFVQGVDTKTNRLLAMKLRRLENMVLRDSTLQKRPGTVALPSNIPSTSADPDATQTAGEALFLFQGQLTRINGGVAYALAAGANGGWIARNGSAATYTIGNASIRRGTVTANHFDMATNNGVTAIAWHESGGSAPGIHVSVLDETSGALYGVAGATAVSATGDYPRCVAVGTYLFVVWGDTGGNIKAVIIGSTQPDYIPSATTLVTDYNQATFYAGSPGGFFDAISFNGSLALVYPRTGGGGKIRSSLVNTSGTVTGSTDLANSPGAACGMALRLDATPTLYAFWGAYDGGNGMTCVTVNTSNTVVATIHAVATATGEFKRAAPYVNDSGTITVLYQKDGTTNSGTGLRKVTVNSTSVTVADAAVTNSENVVLAGEFSAANILPLTTTETGAGSNASLPLMPTGYLVNTSLVPLAKVLPGLTEELPTVARLPRAVALTGSEAFLFAQRLRLALQLMSGVPFDASVLGITRTTLTAAKANQVPITTVGNNTFVGGAWPRIYDGTNLLEADFNQAPEGFTVASHHAGTGNLSAGTYYYQFIFSWTDAQGNLQRSPVSESFLFTAVALDGPEFTVKAFPLPQKTGIQLEVYRTEANGSIFYRASAVNTLLTPSGGLYTYTDTLSDASLIQNEVLYTTGGVGDWVAPPAYSASCSHGSRLIVAGLEDAFAWQSSSESIAGEALRFNEDWGGRIPQDTGGIVACASMDGNLILLTVNGGYLVPGTGPDLLGNNPWPPPQRITSLDVGCSVPQAVCSTPVGIVFKSTKGWMLLERSLQARYLGAEVEFWNSFTPRCATLRGEVEEVWFQCDPGDDAKDVSGMAVPGMAPSLGGVALVWNYRYEQWSVIPDYGAQSACYYQGKYSRVRSDGPAFQEAPGTWLASSTAYSSLVETGWLKVAGLQGFQRILRVLFLGLYNSAFTLKVEVGYNYNSNYLPEDTVTLDGTGLFIAGENWQARLKPRIQKCEAIRFRLTDLNIGGSGQGMNLVDMTLEVAVKGTAYKLKAAQSL